MTSAAATVPKQARADDDNSLRLVHLALAVGVVALIVFAVVGTFFTTVSEGVFTHTADYWYTGVGVPIAFACIAQTIGLRRLQHGADGRLGTVGLWVNMLALVELAVQLLASVIAGAELRWGPLYVVCTFLSFIGVALIAAGSWRTGLLPRWMLGVWPLVWILGSFAAPGPMPLVLAVFFVLFGVVLTRRVRGSSA